MVKQNRTKLLILGGAFAALVAVAIVAMVKGWGEEGELPKNSRESASSASATKNGRERQLLAALERASTINPSTDGNKLRAILRPVAKDFAEIQAGDERGKANWQKVVLNRAGKRMDGLRFRIPDGPPRSLYWATILPEGGNPDDWRLFAPKGEVNGYMTRKMERPERFANLPEIGVKPATLITQRLLADRLETGKDYAIWFHFTSTEPVELWVAMNLLPQSEGDLRTVDALGLKQKALNATTEAQ